MSWDDSWANQAPKKRDPAVERAESQGFEIVVARSNELQIDLDNGAKLNQDVYEKLCIALGTPKHKEWESRSMRGKHVVLTFTKDFTDAEAIGLECALGGDPVRALMCYLRLYKDYRENRVLFRPTDKVHPDLLGPHAELSQEQMRQVFVASARMAGAI